MKRVRFPFALAILAGSVTAFVECQDATQMFVEVSTDLRCNEHGGTSIAVGKLGALDNRSPATFATTCKDDGTIGTLVIVPSGDEDAELAFQVTTGIGVEPATCGGPTTSASCIVARRALRFLPHESLHIHVPMKNVCAGITCDPQSTCFDGRCVAATIDESRCHGGICGEDALGDGGADAAVDAQALPNDEGAMVIGENHSCLLVEGKVYCWGSNENGQLGIGAPTAPDPEIAVPTLVPNLTDVVAISAGTNTTGALTRDGTVYLWGDPGANTIPGQGTAVTTPYAPSNVPKLEQLCVGHLHACGVTIGGTALECWGNVTTDTTLAPTPFPLDVKPSRIGCGDWLTVVRLSDGTVRTSGDPTASLGRGSAVNGGATPIAVPGLTGVTSTYSGVQDAFAIDGSGRVFGWGTNKGSVLGDFAQHASPLEVAAYAGYAPIAIGYTFACGLKNGQIACWGTNPYGQLGRAPGELDRSTDPVGVALPDPATMIWAGGNHACARTTKNEIYCWGANDSGQLGIGTHDNPPDHGSPTRLLFP